MATALLVIGAGPSDASAWHHPRLTCMGRAVTIVAKGGITYGTAGDDVILGTAGPDDIRAGAGNDIICAGAGDDQVLGEDGSDVIDLGAGNDVADAGSGNDVIWGGDGDDALAGGTGNDNLYGGAGDDRLSGGPGWDQISGDDGNDVLLGDDQDDRLWGGAGQDQLFGGAGNDSLFGGPGDDVLRGEAGYDRLFGGPDNDDCDGGTGRNRVYGCEDQTGESGVSVTVSAPEGISANVVLADSAGSFTAIKPPEGASATTDLTIPSGTYTVQALPVTLDGVRYVADLPVTSLKATPGSHQTIVATYAADGGAQMLHVTQVAATGVGLAWVAAAGSPSYVVRRTTGEVPASAADQGTLVPVSGTTASDTGLSGGSTYSYALFARQGSRTVGPITLSVTTPGAADVSEVLPSSSRIYTAAEISSATPNDDGVRFILAGGVPAPVVGAGVVLPITADLPSGFLGAVAAVGTDGRTIDLVPAGLADVFDYFSADIPDLSAVPDADVAGAKVAAAQPLAATADICSANPHLSFDHSIALGGHFSTAITNYHAWGVDIPTGGTIDLGLQATVTGALGFDSASGFSCEAPFGKVKKTFTVGGVPFAFQFTPTAQIGITGSGFQVKNLGVSATAGFTAKATIDASGVSVDGGPVFSVKPLTPQASLVRAKAELKLSGEMLFGPGVDTGKAGIIAGVDGTLTPLDLTAGSQFPFPDPRADQCFAVSAKMGASVGLKVQAFVGRFSKSATQTIWSGDRNYPNSPWHFPSGCSGLPNPTPTPTPTVPPTASPTPTPSPSSTSGSNPSVTMKYHDNVATSVPLGAAYTLVPSVPCPIGSNVVEISNPRYPNQTRNASVAPDGKWTYTYLPSVLDVTDRVNNTGQVTLTPACYNLGASNSKATLTYQSLAINFTPATRVKVSAQTVHGGDSITLTGNQCPTNDWSIFLEQHSGGSSGTIVLDHAYDKPWSPATEDIRREYGTGTFNVLVACYDNAPPIGVADLLMTGGSLQVVA